MKILAKDMEGNEGAFVAIIIVLIICAFLLLPIIIGWAVIFVWQFFTDNTEVYGLFFKWLLGIAIMIVVWLLGSIFHIERIERPFSVRKEVHIHHKDSFEDKDYKYLEK